MMAQVQLGDIAVEVVLKDIKNVHLSVHPPTGRVRIAAPSRMSLDRIRVFAISKLDWIKLQQKKLRGQEREKSREYLERESHYVWGKRYLLKVAETNSVPAVDLQRNLLVLRIRPGSGEGRKQVLLEEWYRERLKAAVPPLIAKWESLLGIKVKRFFAQKMKTKWGSCSHSAGSIRLNTELAKKPAECLEYIVAHEMIHLIEPTHNSRFIALMDQFMPNWQFQRQELNRLPVRLETWEY